MDGARMTAVQRAERLAVTIDRCAHKPGILSDRGLVPDAPS